MLIETEIPENLVNVKRRIHKYSLCDKKSILLEQTRNNMSNRVIAKKYLVGESSIRKWKKSIDLSLDYCKDKLTLHGGQVSSGIHLEPALCQWIDELRNDSCDITVELAVFELMKLDPGFKGGEFSLIRRWVYGFIQRNGYSIRNKTHISQKPLNEAECHDFSVSVNERNNMYRVPAEFFVNMDETPLYNDSKPTRVISDKGASSVNGRKTRTGDYRSTVFLAVSAGGHKLTPMIVFKAKPGKSVEKSFKNKKEGYPDDVICVCQENAWCDTPTMAKWVDLVYGPYVAKNTENFSHLIMDDYSAHKVKVVTDKIKNTGSLVSIMPGGSTSRVQVLDVGINKPFKDKFRTAWTQWMITENRQNNLSVSRPLLAQWVSSVWKSIDTTTVEHTWAKCGYYNTN
jgi:hypothetical protein